VRRNREIEREKREMRPFNLSPRPGRCGSLEAKTVTMATRQSSGLGREHHSVNRNLRKSVREVVMGETWDKTKEVAGDATKAVADGAKAVASAAGQAVSKAAEATAEVVGTVAGTAVKAGTAAIDKTKELAGKAADVAEESTKATAETARDAGKAVDKTIT
jgi:hypothetical protein